MSDPTPLPLFPTPPDGGPPREPTPDADGAARADAVPALVDVGSAAAVPGLDGPDVAPSPPGEPPAPSPAGDVAALEGPDATPPTSPSEASADGTPLASEPLPTTPVPPGPSRRVVLSARGLRKSFRVGPERVEVLRGADLDVHEGEILAILGQSGSGKSTFLHVLGLLDRADAGTIELEGRDRASLSAGERASVRATALGFVFQFYHLLPELTALENVMLPSMIVRAGAAERAAALARAHAALARVGLAARERHRPSQLSGGERQRVAIARALQNRPRILLCDEPTGNLDGRTAAAVRDLLWDLNAVERQTLVIVTHDASLAAQAHRVVQLRDGVVVEPDGAPAAT